jgi:L-aspartate oxidase
MKTGALVIGAGVAGLAAALAIDDRPVAIASEAPLGRDLASAWAQGGIAAALGRDDSPAQHAADTRAAGAGIADDAAVDVLAAEAPLAIATLVALGVPFARDGDGALALGLEGAHAHRRVAHVADATGAAITRALLDAVRARPNVTLLEGVRAQRLLTGPDGAVRGAVLVAPAGDLVVVTADAVVLATGGFGGLYARTTTPLGSRGAGIAMAGRAGAALADLEFVQFHPTALHVASDPLPLVSEAVRGEGAVLVDGAGTRIMTGIDPRAELAPRDVVARTVAAAERSGRSVFLDARTAIGARFAERFPGIFAVAMRAGMDPRTAPIPITPAAHYTIGGVATDLDGHTSLPGLWACGEAAATGLHGANRLASNSLVEGLVFGARAGRAVAASPRRDRARGVGVVPAPVPVRGDDRAVLQQVRLAMSAGLGVLRDAAGMARALALFEAIEADPPSSRVADAAYVAAATARAALARRESRGAHQRADYPHADPAFAHRTLLAGVRPALARTS